MLNNADFVASGGVTTDYLLQEIETIEKRLEELGYDGDCAYEKAMVAFYRERLDQCSVLLQASEEKPDQEIEQAALS